ncbi:hypothetical protein BN135_1814 [Cronobacter muytjensii 530]
MDLHHSFSRGMGITDTKWKIGFHDFGKRIYFSRLSSEQFLMKV